MADFKGINDFIGWFKQTINKDLDMVRSKNIPSDFFNNPLWDSHLIVNDYHKLSKEEQFKNMDKKSISRVEIARKNLTINTKHAYDINNRIINDEVLALINNIKYDPPNNEELEPYHFYIFLHTVEQIQFFIKSKITPSSNDLFAISKEKYDRGLEKLKADADRIQFFFDDELIDNQVRIRIPTNPKVAISQMIWALQFQDDKDNSLARHLFEEISSYFGCTPYGTTLKLRSKDLFNTYFMQNKSSYRVYTENSIFDTLYFYKPPLKLNYKS